MGRVFWSEDPRFEAGKIWMNMVHDQSQSKYLYHADTVHRFQYAVANESDPAAPAPQPQYPACCNCFWSPGSVLLSIDTETVPNPGGELAWLWTAIQDRLRTRTLAETMLCTFRKYHF